MTFQIKVDRPQENACRGAIKAVLFLAHGAGADMDHHFMEEVSGLLVQQNIEVVRFNFPFMEKRKLDGKRRPPDRMPKLLAHYLAVLKAHNTELPVFIAGKSMGGRVAATLMSTDLSNTENDNVASVKNKISGVMCLGYPFHPPKKLDKLRLEPLQSAALPVKILQGERDALGSYDDIQGYDLSALCEVTYLPDGDHDLKPRVKSGFTHAQHIQTAVNEMVSFIDQHI